MRTETTTARLARLGFHAPAASAALLEEAEREVGEVVERLAIAADPDAALTGLVRLARVGVPLAAVLEDEASGMSLVRVLGASTGLAACIERNPAILAEVTPRPLPARETLGQRMLESIGDASVARADAMLGLRRAYRSHVLAIAAFDLAQEDPASVVHDVAAALADLAGATLDASLALARRTVGASRFGQAAVDATRLAIIGMGKLGARELNYVSDVDVIWVHAADGIDDDRAAMVAQALARETTAGCMEASREPMLWEVDANLRPEGKDGALTRTLSSHVRYYERWAKSWEFQALLKARCVAGDAELGAEYEDAVRGMVWRSSSREGFVESVQRMRERVTEHIAADEVEWQLKLGPGGIRDIEFTIQLLQLVHGATDEHVRDRGTLDALASLEAAGMIGRIEAAEFAGHYRFLRVLEHRVQLWRMSRTHLMPSDPDGQRRLARSARLHDAATMLERWRATKRAVRSLHERLFYRPLLAAVASLPDGGAHLTSESAIARLQASGFADAKAALEHIGALTNGVSRRAQIQRVLLPVLLQWLSEGPDPDMGLLAFRRLSHALGESPWYLRMLRDSALAAQRLMSVLSSSRLIANLIERIPEAAHWLADEGRMRQPSRASLAEEAQAIVARHRDDRAAVRTALQALRRRELLRAALASALGIDDVLATGASLTTIAAVVLEAAIGLLAQDDVELAVVSMGRTGGREIGFGSDVDVLWVASSGDGHVERATRIVREIGELLADPIVRFELDAGLRPEGKQGPLVRSLESYRAYYERWSLPWEAQALLRAAPLAGSARLTDEFLALVEPIRHPAAFPEASEREIRRIKARVEGERLPRNADRARHLKLGHGSLSDIEWLVQLRQLQHASDPTVHAAGTLAALGALVDAGHVSLKDAVILRRAWMLASTLRNALALAQARTIDQLPSDRDQLEVVARLLGRPPGSAGLLDEEYLRVTRRARKVFEASFWE